MCDFDDGGFEEVSFLNFLGRREHQAPLRREVPHLILRAAVRSSVPDERLLRGALSNADPRLNRAGSGDERLPSRFAVQSLGERVTPQHVLLGLELASQVELTETGAVELECQFASTCRDGTTLLLPRVVMRFVSAGVPQWLHLQDGEGIPPLMSTILHARDTLKVKVHVRIRDAAGIGSGPPEALRAARELFAAREQWHNAAFNCADGTSMPFHTFVVAPQSSVVEAALSSLEWSKPRGTLPTLPCAFSPRLLESALGFLYGATNVAATDAGPLYELADYYCMAALKTAARSLLLRQLAAGTLVTTLQLAVTFADETLKEAVCRMLRDDQHLLAAIIQSPAYQRMLVRGTPHAFATIASLLHCVAGEELPELPTPLSVTSSPVAQAGSTGPRGGAEKLRRRTSKPKRRPAEAGKDKESSRPAEAGKDKEGH